MAKLKFRTDLAVENKEMHEEKNKVEISGVKVTEEYVGDIKILRIRIMDEHGSKTMGKPVGNYVTIEIHRISEADERMKQLCGSMIAQEIKSMLPDVKSLNALVVGLGNEKVTPDALGPLTVERVTATRHYFQAWKDKMQEGVGCVSVVTPGVMGDTGIESADIIQGVINKVHPNVVIVIDALAARNADRINTTIQISDTGISPGSGMGNHRKGLNQETTGVKVIAIGVPTVIDSATLIFDTLMEYGIDEFGHEIGDHITGLAIALENDEEMANRFMEELGGQMIVTSSEIDTVIHEFSRVLSNGINAALHPGMNLIQIHNSFGR